MLEASSDEAAGSGGGVVSVAANLNKETPCLNS